MNANEPAFPIESQYRDSITGIPTSVIGTGLTKREYFAAMAMQGLCAFPEPLGPFSGIAQAAVEAADALIAELAKEAS